MLKYKMKKLSVLLLFNFALPVYAAPLWDSNQLSRVVEVITKYYPDADITQHNGQLRAKYSTMEFTVHRHWKTGEYLQLTDQIEGPNFKGFILQISVESGKYTGQAIIPQILRQPYWQTYIDRPATIDGKSHYVINFSFGSRVDSKFKDAIIKAFRKTSNANNAQ